MFKKTFAALAVAAVALSAGSASANLNLGEMGALLAIPFVTAPGDNECGECRFAIHSGVFTEIVVTNGTNQGVNLHINIINGDDGEKWDTQSFACNVTARETTHFIFDNDNDGGSSAKFECSATGADSNSPDSDLNVPRDEALSAERGIMVVAVEQGGATVSTNAIWGDATILDVESGLAASVGAISFQGLDALNQDGNRQYRFDDLEYSAFPASLAGNFFAPDDNIIVELLLFTLDGTADVTPVPVSVRVFFYNDDELERDANFDFDCFEIVDLLDIDPRFHRDELGSDVGHFQFLWRDSSVQSVHELTGTGIDEFRNTPAHGWLFTYIAFETFQREPDNGDSAATGVRLAQSVNSHTPLAGDIVNFDAR